MTPPAGAPGAGAAAAETAQGVAAEPIAPGEAEALGRSRGGFSTKIHVAVNGLGLPVRLLLTAGQAPDIRQAEALLADLLGDVPGQAVIADKGYDGDALVAAIRAGGAEPVIPPMRHRVEPRAYDEHPYKERNLVERFIGRIKEWRRVATRYEKTARNFLAFVHIASLFDLLR